MKKFAIAGMLAIGVYFGFVPVNQLNYLWVDEEFDHRKQPTKEQIIVIDPDALQED